ncbi:Two-component response regulator, YesN/AraC family, consists of REC and AraC-type DNA-binding domains [Paenibacillus catalpae]|uniref:Two-component response regulator, YesN/AraC family, consists of REC and AraC-type DNA-binding domains n=1 Tax=Paenibacillus catalpae TaxID=1045775 RepID=A0A1I2GW50_9BACL|nr:response regulator transcription factor [Paenibacillus catalpae]SFF20846.1 Two-component response regulator, YesN/AraC family, consists of REC and AraC-type DNA-binding domains [Paenibacillus catalpae]
MYNVLIVDDEPVARQSLRYLIDWEELGFTVKGEAQDGRQALDMLRSQRYDLVLTDIRMPVVNGLEMAAEMQEFTDTPVVILSGYDDFAYAREGLRLGVKEYLLKPVDEEDLIALLKKLAAGMREQQLLEKRQRLGLSAGRDQLLRRWVHGQIAARELEEQLRLLGLQTSEEKYACLLLELDFIADGEMQDRDTDLMRFAIRNIAEELTSGRGYVFEESEERIGILIGGPAHEMGLDECRQWAEKLLSSAMKYAKASVTIGIGGSVSAVTGIKQSWSEAEEALDGKFLSGAGTVLVPHGQAAEGEGERDTLRTLESEVLEMVRSCRRAEAIRALARLWECFRVEQVPESRAKMSVLELLIQLFRLMKEQGASHDRLFDPSLGDYERIMRIKTMDELLRFTESKCGDVVDAMLRMKEVRPNKIVAEVKRIVQEQYSSPISLREVAATIYMNPNYLGKLFKANTEQSFNDYVLQVRMEKAKELLLHTDKKVYEIAQEVGFSELDWFYKRFKAYTGVSTGDYRNAR